MSANGAFTNTLDYDLFSAGFVTLKSGLSGTLEFVQSSTGEIPIFGVSSGDIGFTFLGKAGAPFLKAEASGTLDFSFTGTLEIGREAFLSAYSIIPFEGSASGLIRIKGSIAGSIDFGFSSTLTQYSEIEGSTSYSFILNSTGLNISTHALDKVGQNGFKFTNEYFNGATLVSNMNSIEIRDNGIRNAQVLQR